jgi:hypothetical protein
MPERAPDQAELHTPHGSTHHPPPHHYNNTLPQTQPNNKPPTPITTHQREAGYTSLPLPTLSPTDTRVLSHNINSLPTSSIAELGATFDLYHHLSPSIIGLQETNKIWNCYDATIGRLKTCIQRRWPGSKLSTAHCSESTFKSPAQPGGLAQMILCQLTARVTKYGNDPYG